AREFDMLALTSAREELKEAEQTLEEAIAAGFPARNIKSCAEYVRSCQERVNLLEAERNALILRKRQEAEGMCDVGATCSCLQSKLIMLRGIGFCAAHFCMQVLFQRIEVMVA
ncbi:MAG TPA: hypothetical protein VEF04_05045, partial [Blastocatellia bacterium]|nr:hypothetical protein [Blastocatellia bacterium]